MLTGAIGRRRLLAGIVGAAVACSVPAVWLLASRSNDPQLVIVEARPTDDPEAPFAFDPALVVVPVGATVRWVNRSRTFHTVTFGPASGERVSDGSFDESMFEVGDIVERTFATPGDHRYFCQPHVAFMAGTVRVAGR